MKDKKHFLFVMITALVMSPFYAQAGSGGVGSQSWLLGIIDFFLGPWVKGVACLFFIGTAIGFMVTYEQNGAVSKRLIQMLIGSAIFIIAQRLVSMGLQPSSLRLGRRSFSTFYNIEKLFDKPLAMGMSDFGGMLYNLERFVITLVTIGATVNIFFQCIAIWAGTQELRKFYVDVIFKSVIVIVMLNIYPLVQSEVFQLATDVGARASGGIERINAAFANANEYLREVIKQWMVPLLQKVAEKGGTVDGSGNLLISTEFQQKLSNELAVDPQVIEQYTRGKIKYAYAEHEKYREYAIDETGNSDLSSYTEWETSAIKQWYDANGNPMDTKKTGSWFSGLFKGHKKQIDMLKSGDVGKIRDQINKVMALASLMTGYTIRDVADLPIEDQKRINTEMLTTDLDKLFYNPYLADDDGNPTTIIAPSSLMKTCFLLGDVMADAAAYESGQVEATRAKKAKEYGDSGNLDKTPDDQNFKIIKAGTLTWPNMKKAIMNCFFFLGLFICSIIACVEYTICVWEYFIVTSLAVLLIPLFFLEATKSYAMNIIKIFLSYFMKLLVMTVATYYVFALYISAGLQTYANNDPHMIETLGLYVFICLLGAIFIVSSEKISSILLTGNPQMSIGDIVRGANSAMRFGRGAAGVAHGALSAAKGVGRMAQSGVRGMQSLGALGSGMRSAYSEAAGQVKSKGGDAAMQAQAGRMAAGSTFGAAAKQYGKDSATKFFTGKNAQHFNPNGLLDDRGKFQGVGSALNVNGQQRGTSTFRDAQKSAQGIGKNKGLEAADRVLNKSGWLNNDVEDGVPTDRHPTSALAKNNGYTPYGENDDRRRGKDWFHKGGGGE